jgi:hypothetical protein
MKTLLWSIASKCPLSVLYISAQIAERIEVGAFPRAHDRLPYPMKSASLREGTAINATICVREVSYSEANP